MIKALAAVLALVVAAVAGLVFLVVAGADNAVTANSCQPATVTADGSPTILGGSTLTAQQITTWWQSSGHAARTPIGVDIATLAGWYVDHGDTDDVRGDVAFAQAVEETGYFSSSAAQRNNFAGIGITGPSVAGYDFATPEDGVVAQIQLLREVAAGNDTTFAEPRVAPTWGGRPAETWAGLAGNWAVDPGYWDPKIKTIYTSMSTAGQQRAPNGTLVGAQSGCATNVDVPSGGSLGPLWTFLGSQLGKPYVYGGVGPDAWDCSGLMMVAWEQVGLQLPRTAAEQYASTESLAVVPAQMEPGDLVFWSGDATAAGVEHVAIYVGNDEVLDAPHTGTVVQVQPIWTDGLYAITRPAAILPIPTQLTAAS